MQPAPHSGHYLSCARRFVVAPGPTADGIEFSGGLIVLRSRITGAIEMYPSGWSSLPGQLAGAVEWIDALRPPGCDQGKVND